MSNRVRPGAGDPAPDFTLVAGDGRSVTLSALLEHSHVILYFVREYT